MENEMDKLNMICSGKRSLNSIKVSQTIFTVSRFKKVHSSRFIDQFTSIISSDYL